MTITPDQARQLLAAHTPGNWGLTMGARFPTGVAKLALAAPDLARTVIDQAEEIERLKRMLDTVDEELNNYRNQWGDL
ncbi:hypothetical protein ACT3SZ_12410 [Corynebacterium sp. AOP40-9SA-29]|uniref:hypothetical protein n=1 Tax=Corynebacterium sp. AOP40-9SA-29 TaxID=3457677 RepID=UPI00403325D4